MRFLILLVIVVGGYVQADDRRAQVNYMLHCQGCHLPNAEGADGRVPPMNDFVGLFLHSEAGRDFLIRVPGVAQSALGDDEIAELMNWILLTFSPNQLPDPFLPYSQKEVETLRDNPERDPESARETILAGIAQVLEEPNKTLR